MTAHKIRPLESSEIQATAELHAACLPDDLLTTAGPALLETFYRVAIEDPRSRVLVAGQAGHPLGLVVASADGRKVMRKVPQSSPLALLVGGCRVLRRRGWSWVAAGIQGLWLPGPPLPPAEIVYYFVAESCRGQGIGRALLEASADAFRGLGISSWHAKVAAQNLSGKNAYAASGGRPGATFKHAGRDFEAMIFS